MGGVKIVKEMRRGRWGSEDCEGDEERKVGGVKIVKEMRRGRWGE